MLVEGEGSPQNELDCFRGHLLVGYPIIIPILLRDIYLLGQTFQLAKAFDMGYLSFLGGISHQNDYPILYPQHCNFQICLFSLFIL